MALCNLKNFLVKVLIVIVIVFNLQDPCHISASPSPLFFDAIANFFKPNRQPSGSSSSYGAPKPISFRPVTVTISPNYNRPATGATKPSYNRPNNGFGGVGIPKLPRFKLPKLNFPSFGGKGKRPSGSASYGPPKKPSYGQNGSPGRPPRPIVPNVQNTSPTRRPSYRPQPVPSGPLPVYIPTQRPNNRPQPGRPVRPGSLPHYGGQRPGRPGITRPTQPAPRPTQPFPRPTQPHCNACSGPWNTVLPGYNQQTTNSATPTYFPTFPSNGQTVRQPQYGQSSGNANGNGSPLPTYSSTTGVTNYNPSPSTATSSNFNPRGKFPKNMGVIDSSSSIDSYGSPQAPVIATIPPVVETYNNAQTSSIDSYGSPQAPVQGSASASESYGSPQAPVANSESLDDYGSSNNHNNTSISNDDDAREEDNGDKEGSSVDDSEENEDVVTENSIDEVISDNTDNTTIEPITITKTTTIITRTNNGKERGRGLNFNSQSKGCSSSSKNNCSLSENNKSKKLSELKIYGTQSSAIQGSQSDADRFRINFTNFMKEQSDLDGVKYNKKNEKIVAELDVESPNLTIKESEGKLPQFKNDIEVSGEKEEVRSGKVHSGSDDKFGDEWVPISLKKAMANVLGHKDDANNMNKDQKNRNPKALARDQKKIALMDALIDLARKMAKKKAKERNQAKQAARDKKEREEFESALLSTFTPPRINPSQTNDSREMKDIVPSVLTTLAPPIASTRPPRDSKLSQLYPEDHNENKSDDYDDTVWHRNPFRSEQDPVTRRTRPKITTARPTPTTIRFPLEEFLEDTMDNPLVDDGLLEGKVDDNKEEIINEMKSDKSDEMKKEITMTKFDEGDAMKEEITTQRPRSPKSFDLNDESFDRGLSTLATLATLTDAELNEEFNLVGHEGVSTQKPVEPLKEVRTIIVRRDKGGNFKVNGKDVNKILAQTPKITPLPDVFRLKDRKNQNSDFAIRSTPSPIAIIGGTNFKSLTVQPTQSTLRTIQFNPTTATIDFDKPKSENSIMNDEDMKRKGKDVKDKATPQNTGTWVWQTKEMDENGNEVITGIEKLVKDRIISELQKQSNQDSKDDFSPTVQLTEDDFVLLGDSWFKDKSKLSEHLKMPEVLTLPSEPVPTSSNMDIHEDDPRSSPSPHQAIKRLDTEPHAQPLELINPFMLSNPSLTIAPPTVSSIAFPHKSSSLSLENDLLPSPEENDDENKSYSLDENIRRSKNWVLLSSPHNGNYDYEFDSIDAIETYDDYYNNGEYDDENEIYDLNRKIEKDAFDFKEERRSKNVEEESTTKEKSEKSIDSFRPSINLNNVLPSSNRFLPLRANGKDFKEFVNSENRRNRDFHQDTKPFPVEALPLIKDETETTLEGDYRLTSFDAIPLRTNAKTLHQLVSDPKWTSKSSPIRSHSNLRLGKNAHLNEVQTSKSRNQSSNQKLRQSSGISTSTGKNVKSSQSVLKKSHSKDDLSSRRTKKIDLDDLMVFYPLHGKPFLSFPPSKSFSTIAKYKRQIY